MAWFEGLRGGDGDFLQRASGCRRAVAIAVLGGVGFGSGALAVPDGGGNLDGRAAQVCVSPAQRAAVAAQVSSFERRAGKTAELPGAVPKAFSFFPQAGTLWRDVFPNNFVDLDPTPGVADWHCTDFTYDGHLGIDCDIISFAYQEVGVPVFAALDGTVVARNDGQADQNTEWNDVPANYVVLHHGGSHYTYYWHLKNGSVGVNLGDWVPAGQQIGQTGSSGISTGPHLHFEAEHGGQSYETFAGPCRAGSSHWETQPPFDSSLRLRELILTQESLSTWQGPLFDISRTGTLLQGGNSFSVLLRLQNLPAASSYRYRFLRPNGSVAFDSGTGPFEAPSNPFYRASFWYHSQSLNFDQTGSWTLEYQINGVTVARAPVRVVASAAQNTNRAPGRVTVELDPVVPTDSEVVFCRVTEQDLPADPDYDLVRYRYIWSVNGQTVRNVVTAGRADALPHTSYGPGDTVDCHVTPGDGKSDGTAASVSGRIAGSRIAPLQTVTVSGGGGFQELLYNYVTGELDITPYLETSARVPRWMPREQWTGIYHYDYGAGAYTQGTFSFKDAL